MTYDAGLAFNTVKYVKLIPETHVSVTFVVNFIVEFM